MVIPPQGSMHPANAGRRMDDGSRRDSSLPTGKLEILIADADRIISVNQDPTRIRQTEQMKALAEKERRKGNGQRKRHHVGLPWQEPHCSGLPTFHGCETEIGGKPVAAIRMLADHTSCRKDVCQIEVPGRLSEKRFAQIEEARKEASALFKEMRKERDGPNG